VEQVLAPVRRYLLAAIVVVLAGTAGYLSLVIQQRQAALSALSGADLSWSVNQVSVELLRFGQALGARIAQLPDGSQNLEARYEILLSRVDLLTQGEEYRTYFRAAPEDAAVFAEVQAAVASLEELITSSREDGLHQALSEVMRVTPRAMEVAANANSFRANRASARQLDLLHLHWGFSAVSASLVFVGLLQLASLARQNRQLQQAHASLRLQNSRFDAAISNIPQGLALLDAEQRLLIRNEQLASVLEIEPAELQPGVALEEVLRRATTDRGREPPPVVDGAQTFELGGKTVAVVRQPMRTGGAILTAEDITPRLEAEKQRKHLEAQLQQAQKMEAVGQLTGGIAHDFNNLLTVILGNAEILAEDPGDEQTVQLLATMILQAAERGADLTNKLLAFGRRQSLTPERLDVAECVQGIVPLLRRVVSENVELRTDFGPGPSMALVDRSLLESALLNLVVNARDAMTNGGVLTITTGKRVAGNGLGALQDEQKVVFVSVTDTGTGMPKEVLDRVFEPFFTTKEVGKGSGLGLSMVYGFAEQSGGFVEIDSQIQVGTRVTILLPALQVEEVASDANPERPRTGLTSAPQAGRVLVVEDDPQVLDFVSAQVESLGYEVTSARTAREALELLRRAPSFDVLFSDVVLPEGMNGVELSNLVHNEHPLTKVVLTSGYAEEVFTNSGRPAPGTVILKKPYKKTELAQVLSAALEGSADRSLGTAMAADMFPLRRTG
jgi:signal transduction histidine kinase/CheY-like chemotaxis protein